MDAVEGWERWDWGLVERDWMGGSIGGRGLPGARVLGLATACGPRGLRGGYVQVVGLHVPWVHRGLCGFPGTRLGLGKPFA